ncbi:MAG: hypothetical protein ABW089_07005 [Sedimenticola sp.]
MSATPKQPARYWNDIPHQEQLRLREEYGHYLDQLPPTCDLGVKIERFRQWLAEHGIHYEADS